VRKSLTETDNVITFTPTTAGTVRIACSMNMYTGSFMVV
jgi:plastocyanin domain-containing protein